ncbi:NAD(FAD)-dependent dehydrogenase [Anopheles sinensis]|uniref:NAD(FAD)-dependent dehydrogenase n=1 Tax=Anopheles sinensis TaxID=74873 RepID=A0A084VTR9_ANOSI|nr:NAD(FAD)-dependent dehydrogenase [Anopheles sinensis]
MVWTIVERPACFRRDRPIGDGSKKPTVNDVRNRDTYQAAYLPVCSRQEQDDGNGKTRRKFLRLPETPDLAIQTCQL